MLAWTEDTNGNEKYTLYVKVGVQQHSCSLSLFAMLL
jgi:hypothetical protein